MTINEPWAHARPERKSVFVSGFTTIAAKSRCLAFVLAGAAFIVGAGCIGNAPGGDDGGGDDSDSTTAAPRTGASDETERAGVETERAGVGTERAGVGTERAGVERIGATDYTVAATPPSVSPGKKGLTWRKVAHDNARGQDTVSCNTSCDPYVGDTACTESRPILCLRNDGSGSNGFVPSFYEGWAAGNIGLTPPVTGTALTSLAAADAQCVATFGAGWRMAEHHDGGGGWAWRAYGNINDAYNVNVAPYNTKNRFWVHINDQPGNCWNP